MTNNEMALMANIAVDMQDEKVNEVLNKIKTEIKELYIYIYTDSKGNVIENRVNYDEVMQIINKYIAKSRG